MAGQERDNRKPIFLGKEGDGIRFVHQQTGDVVDFTPQSSVPGGTKGFIDGTPDAIASLSRDLQGTTGEPITFLPTKGGRSFGMGGESSWKGSKWEPEADRRKREERERGEL